MTSPRATLERVRVTRVGVGFIALTVLVGFASVNTGNNALYMVEATLLSVMVVSGLASRRNLQGMEAAVEAPREIYANQPFTLRFGLVHRDRWVARRWLEISVDDRSGADLLPLLERGRSHAGSLHLLIARRGRHHFPHLRVGSIFPFGLFYKVMRYKIDLELLAFPEIFPASVDPVRQTGRSGDEPSRAPGWGHELLSLRRFRSGDDPRGIHWKQTARTGGLVFMERESEEGRRLSILLDNAVGTLSEPDDRTRFERLVSEAASAAVAHLKAGFEVELVTRDAQLPYGRGRAHQLRVLEALALLEARPEAAAPLRRPEERAPELRLGFAASRRDGR